MVIQRSAHPISTPSPLTAPLYPDRLTDPVDAAFAHVADDFDLPVENRVEANAESVPSGSVTLASVLRANGYKTAAFIGSFILDRIYGLDKGFDVYDSPFETAPGATPNPYSARVRRDAALVTRAARQWIDRNHGEPFFVFLHLYDLHTPYMLPQVAGPTPSVAGYDTELEYVDQTLGRLRQALVTDGVWDRSLVILLADHGEGLGDHGETSHGYFIYESTMHVPLIVHWPAALHSTRARGRVRRIDRCGANHSRLAAHPGPASFAGVSLLPVAAGTRPMAKASTRGSLSAGPI